MRPFEQIFASWLRIARTCAMVAMALACLGACDREAEPLVSSHVSLALPRLSLAHLTPVVDTEAPPLATEPARPRVSLDLPDRCNRLLWKDTDASPVPVLSKERPTWLRTAEGRSAHQAKIRELVYMVADELGADETAAEMVCRLSLMLRVLPATASPLLSVTLTLLPKLLTHGCRPLACS